MTLFLNVYLKKVTLISQLFFYHSQQRGPVQEHFLNNPFFKICVTNRHEDINKHIAICIATLAEEWEIYSICIITDWTVRK